MYKPEDIELPANFVFESISEIDDVSNWSTDLRRYFLSLKDEYFIYGLEDYFLLEPVRQDIVSVLSGMITDKTGRICLNNDLQTRPHDIIEKFDDYSVIRAKQDTEYRVSTQLSIWSRSYLLKYLEDSLDPWHFEINKSREAKDDGFDIIGTKDKYAVEYSIGRRKNNPELNFDYINSRKRSLDESIITEMRELNLI